MLLSREPRARLCLGIAAAVHAVAFALEPHNTVHEIKPVALDRSSMLLELASIVQTSPDVVTSKALQPSSVESSRPAIQRNERASVRALGAPRVPAMVNAAITREPTALVEREELSTFPREREGVPNADSPRDASNTLASNTTSASGGVTLGPGATGGTAIAGPQAARLLTTGDPCAGYFPAASPVSKGTVKVRVDVDARGLVTRSAVLLVTPERSGLFQAAIACASRLRFSAAKSSEGRPVAGQATLSLNFERHPQ